MEQTTTNQHVGNQRRIDNRARHSTQLVTETAGGNSTGFVTETRIDPTKLPKPTHEKHGLIKKILRRTATLNSDSKNRIKVTDFRPHQANQNRGGGLGGKLLTGMGNIHQTGPLTPDPTVATMVPSSVSLGFSNPDGMHPLSADARSPTGHVTLVHTMTNGDALRSPTDKFEPRDPCDQIAQLNAVIDKLKATIRARDRRIHDLEREVDKLRSVLEQQLAGSLPPSSGASIAESPTSSEPQSKDVQKDGSKSDSTNSTSSAVVPPGTSPTSTVPPAAFLLHKRLGVSGESSRATEELKYYEKDARSRQQIRDALRSNELLMNLDVVQLQEMVSCMHEQKVPANCYIIREGDDGEHLYVGAEGEYEVSKAGKRLCRMPAGRCFGELALLYNCKRTASVRALVPSRVWVLERGCFQAIMMKTGLERIEERKAFLRSVPLLKDVPAERILRIADALEAQYHSPGDCIIRQGELADSFFIIQSGVVNVTITSTKESGETVEENIRQMSKGEYFGEKALLGEGRRTASVYALGPNGVEVLCLYRKDFVELIGDIEELLNKPYMESESLVSPDKKIPPSFKTDQDASAQSPTSPSSPVISPSAVATLPRLFKLNADGTIQASLPLSSKIKLTDLERVCVLGVGGFGRVDLVTLANDHSQAFAMKRMQKQHIVQTRQQEHVHFEKLILSSVNCPFICKLYATYRDNKYVYMLLEACLGGELWTILRDSHHLDDRATKFCLACCIEALNYLHHHGIIYRDLKPENMLITSTGYIKMCDFGFAKYIGIGQKTWTFCGTPEYVAPEVILNKGHDFAADYWSLGILTYELLTGTPPFQASEPIKIYMKTLKGIDALGLAQNKYISLKALQFIRRLCRFNPSERLGVGKHGIQEIRSHKYFQGFDWAAIVKQTMPTPFKVKLQGPLDHSNFDRFTMDEQEPPDELSGWDENF